MHGSDLNLILAAGISYNFASKPGTGSGKLIPTPVSGLCIISLLERNDSMSLAEMVLNGDIRSAADR